jgi:hypothetical protein
MFFSQLTNEARQRLVDVQQRAGALRSFQAELRRRFAGSMAWKARDGRDYLYRRTRRVEKSLGPRSEATEAIMAAFAAGKAEAEERVRGLRETLEAMAAVNRAMGIGRVPALVGRILRRLDDVGVLGEQICVVGTNALFAYEAAAGIRFDSALLATGDIDIALDARRNLALAGRLLPEGLLGLLRATDPSFAPVSTGHFSAANKSGLMVDLIAPEPKRVTQTVPMRKRRLGGTDLTRLEDLHAVEVPRLEMIVDAPRVSAVAIAEDGLPVWMVAADPRWWAAHKFWLSDERDRRPLKRQRDRDQAKAVAGMLATSWRELDLSDQTLAAIPASLRARLRREVADTEEVEKPAW